MIQEPTEGYQRARKILEKRYGRPHIIALVHIQKLIEGPVLKPNDHKAPSRLCMQMDRCLLTLTNGIRSRSEQQRQPAEDSKKTPTVSPI